MKYEAGRISALRALFQTAAAVALFLLAAGCGPSRETPDAAARDASATPDARPDVARPADASDTRDAAADAFECPPGDGPCVCRPTARRCDPDHPDTPQRCAPDGRGWIADARCAPESGQTCDEGACIAPCADALAAGTRSYLGCEFWPVTLANPLLNPLTAYPFAIAVANPQRYWATVTIDGGALTEPLHQQIAPGALAVITLPWVPEIVTDRAGSVLRRGGAYRVRATAPVIAYQFDPLTYRSSRGDYSQTNDASLLLPTTALRANYTALASAGGFVTVVGTSDTPTRVTVTPTAPIVAGTGIEPSAAGQPRVFELARGDVLQLGSNTFPPEPDAPDLSGSVVEASAPVAVFSGHACARALPDDPDPTAFWTCDHLEDQLLPNETWGRRYAVTRFVDRPGLASRVRVMALRDDTTLAFDPPSAAPAGLPASLHARQFVDFMTDRDFVVTGSGPVLVAQFMLSARSAGDTSDLGDPSLVYEVPVEQFRRDSMILTPSTYTRNYVNIVGATAAPPLLDGAPVTSPASAIGGSGLSVWSLELSPGTHRVTAPGSNDAAYGLKVYGIAPFTSYAYPGGLDLAPIAPPG